MSAVLDTDILIDALHGIRVATRWIEAHADERLAVSIIAVGELYEGAYRFPDPETHLTSMRRFLADFTILGLTDPIMDTFARERARLRQQGLLIPDLDLLVAATAMRHDLTLITRNVRHFGRIPSLTFATL